MAQELHEKLNDKANHERTQVGKIVAGAEAANRDLNAAEVEILADHEAKIAELERQAELARLSLHREAEHVQTTQVVHSISQTEDRLHRTNGEENVYNPRYANLRLDEGGRSFLHDLVLAQGGGTPGEAHDAAERLGKHRQQMKHRGVNFDPGGASMPDIRANTGDLGGLVPPQYLTDEATPLVRGMRPSADAMGPRPLPPTGMSLVVPRITTTSGGASAAGTAEGATAANNDPEIADLTIPVKTIRGWVDISIEATMRGVMVDDLLSSDLQGAVETQVNADLIAGAGSNTLTGLNHGNAIASGNKLDIDTSSPSGIILFQNMMRMAGIIAQHRFRHTTHFMMHPRRLGWLLGREDGNDRPIWQAALSTSTNIVAGGDSAGAYGETNVVVGGVPLVSDSACPTTIDTNQDGVFAWYAPDMLFFESPLMVMRQDPNAKAWSNTVTMGRFVAFAPRFDTSAARLSGTLTAATVV